MIKFDFGGMGYSEQASNENTGVGRIESGVHTVVLEGLFPVQKNGVVTFDLVGKTEAGQKIIVFGLSFEKTFKSGKENPFFARVNELRRVIDCQDFEVGEASRKYNKILGMQPVLISSVGKTCQLALQRSYSEWNGKVKSELTINKTFVIGEDTSGYKVKDYVPAGVDPTQEDTGTERSRVDVPKVDAETTSVAPWENA